MMTRDETIKDIREALKRRSREQSIHIRWSVTGGRGTAWGWISITAHRADQDMNDEERTTLGKLLGKDAPSHHQGESIPASSDHYREYSDRANGRPVTVVGKPYWD